MNLSKKIISVAAGVALVAGAGLAASAPAQAKALPKTGGKTIIDFKPEVVGALVAAGITIEATAPATFVTSPKVMLGFPVTGATGDGITHSGSVTFKSTGNPAGIKGDNPVITLNDDNTATITVSVSGNPVPLLVVKHDKIKYSQWKIDKSHAKWIVKRTVAIGGAVHLTASQPIVDLLNSALSVTVFKADMGLGSSRTTVSEVKTCKANTVKACKAAGA
jgi:hypothetical protein